MRASALALVLAAACAGSSPGPAARDPDEGPGAFEWLPGRWVSGAGTDEVAVEDWSAGDNDLYGVAFATRRDRTVFFEVLAIRDARGTAPTYVAYPGGAAPTSFPLVEAGPSAASFANPEHDDPSRITYRRDGDDLVAELDGAAGPRAVAFRPGDKRRWPELEAADRAFAADSARRGGDAWGDVFVADGAMSSSSGAYLTGPDEIRTAMTRTFLDPRLHLDWAPTTSGTSPAGDAGYTIGRYRLWREGAADGASTGSYVTIWVRDKDPRKRPASAAEFRAALG